MREAEEVEGSRSFGCRVPLVRPREFHDPSLLGMQLQAVPFKALCDDSQHPSGIVLVLEGDDRIVRVPNQV